MLAPLDALDFCSRELVDFRARAAKLKLDTDNLIAGSQALLAESRRMMRQKDGDGGLAQTPESPSLSLDGLDEAGF